MSLPAMYQWLEREPAPKMLLEALKLYGTLEAPGTKNNPTILAWAKEVGLEMVYTKDSTPWCGLFMAVVAKRASYYKVDGVKHIDGDLSPAYVKNPLWALNWGTFGVDGGQPELGDVLTFIRTYKDEKGVTQHGGHVGFYVGEDSKCYHVLGGNTNNAVSIVRIEKIRLRACRQPRYEIGKPKNVRPIVLKSSGALSRNEA